MKRFAAILTAMLAGLLMASGQASPQVRISVITDTAGNLLAPTNFFQKNQRYISNMIDTALASANTNAVWPSAGTNISEITNGNVVTINADVSHAEVATASTNAYAAAVIFAGSMSLNLTNLINAASNILSLANISTSNSIAPTAQGIANSSSNLVYGNSLTQINTTSNSVVSTSQTQVNASSNALAAIAISETNNMGLPSQLAAFRNTNSFASTNVATSSTFGLGKPDNITLGVSGGVWSVIGGGGGGGSATNIYFADSDNATWDIVGGSNRVTVRTNFADLAGSAAAVGALVPTAFNATKITNGASLQTVTSIDPWDRFWFTDTNASPSTNKTIPYSSLASSLVGTLTNVTSLPYANVLQYGAVSDGTTDNTLAFQQAIASGKTVLVPHDDANGGTNGYVIGNIVLTNNGGLISFNNARLLFKAGCSNYMITCGFPVTNAGGFWPTNPPTQNITISGLELDGGNGTNIPVAVGTRHGVWFDLGGRGGTGNLAYNLYIHSFNGVGFEARQNSPFTPGTQFSQNDQSFGRWYSITALTNAVGIRCTSDSYVDPNTPAPFIGEYSHAFNLHCAFNHYGFWCGAGNTTFSDSIFSRNDINVFVDGNSFNDTHSIIANSIINHANLSGVVCTNVHEGFTFNNCAILVNEVWIQDSYGVQIQNGQFWQSRFVVTGGAGNWLRNNTMAKISTGIPQVFITASTNSGAEMNILFDAGGSPLNGALDSAYPILGGVGGYCVKDGVPSSGAIYWPPTFQNLRASSTNQTWMYPSNGVWWVGTFDASSNIVYKAHLDGSGGAGSGTVTSVDAAQNGFTSSGAVTSSGTITLTRSADINSLGYGVTNASKASFTNQVTIGGGTPFADATNVFQVNTLGGARKLNMNTNGDLFINGNGYMNNNLLATTNQLLDASALGASQYVKTGSTTNLLSTLDGASWTNITGTNITLDTSVLSPASNQTNYTASLRSGATGMQTIYGANTNINLSLIGTNNADWGRTVFVNNFTSSVNCNLTFTFTGATNQNLSIVVSNGWAGVFNFWNADSSGTNVLVSDAGRYHH